MSDILHPLSGAIYGLDDDGNIEVTKDGRRGTFNSSGVWLGGEIKSADPHLCQWIGNRPGVTLARHRDQALNKQEALQ